MIESIAQATISKPIQIVFDYLSKLEIQTEYNSSVKKSEKILEPSAQYGLPQYKIEIDLGIFSMKEIYMVTESKSPTLLKAKCLGSNIQFEDVYELEEVTKDLTSLKITDRMELKGLLRWSEPLAHPILKTQMQENLNRLKKNLENH